MKMFKKLMAVALAGVMALVVLTGCASNAKVDKEIVATLNDMLRAEGRNITLESAGEAEAAKVVTVLKAYKAENKDATVEGMLKEEKVIAKLKSEIVAADNTDGIVVSYAKVDEFQSKYYNESKNAFIASELADNVEGHAPLATPKSKIGDTATISLKTDKIGDDTYVIAVVRMPVSK